MLRCAICGCEYDVPGSCPACEGATGPAVIERFLGWEPAAEAHVHPVGEQPLPIWEALATEVSCPSCRTAVPPVSHFCGVCGLRLAPWDRADAATPNTQRGPP